MTLILFIEESNLNNPNSIIHFNPYFHLILNLADLRYPFTILRFHHPRNLTLIFVVISVFIFRSVVMLFSTLVSFLPKGADLHMEF